MKKENRININLDQEDNPSDSVPQESSEDKHPDSVPLESSEDKLPDSVPLESSNDLYNSFNANSYVDILNGTISPSFNDVKIFHSVSIGETLKNNIPLDDVIIDFNNYQQAIKDISIGQLDGIDLPFPTGLVSFINPSSEVGSFKIDINCAKSTPVPSNRSGGANPTWIGSCKNQDTFTSGYGEKDTASPNPSIISWKANAFRQAWDKDKSCTLISPRSIGMFYKDSSCGLCGSIDPFSYYRDLSCGLPKTALNDSFHMDSSCGMKNNPKSSSPGSWSDMWCQKLRHGAPESTPVYDSSNCGIRSSAYPGRHVRDAICSGIGNRVDRPPARSDSCCGLLVRSRGIDSGAADGDCGRNMTVSNAPKHSDANCGSDRGAIHGIPRAPDACCESSSTADGSSSYSDLARSSASHPR